MATNGKEPVQQKRKLVGDELSTSPFAKLHKIEMTPNRLRNLFDIPSYKLAQDILGKIFVRKVDDVICKARIVETECYPGGNDKGSCTFNGKRTPASEPLYMESGTLFVYMTYGMYYCMNISASEPGGGVLIRALEPLEGIDYMRNSRIEKLKKKREIKTEDLCNGPSKLCTSLKITKTDCNTLNLEKSDEIWIENDPNYEMGKVIHTSRIGIAAAGKEWADKPYRFYILKNNCISKRDFVKEKEIEDKDDA